jgi:Fe-Mn family superoxide dismutase
MNNSRRDFLKTTAVLTAALAIAPGLACKSSKSSTAKPTTYPTADGFAQDPLPYAYNALEPHIDARTMEIHYTKHHSAYITKLNGVYSAHKSMMGKSLEELLQEVSKLPADVRETVRNNGGGHWNHTFFWKIMAAPGTQPSADVSAAIAKKWGSMDAFKAEFEKAATSRFGSGWAWLIKTGKGLEITSTPNQDNPLMDVAETMGTPILGVDVWEHAYYLHYQNKRADYLKNFWSVVNWNKVAELYVAT